jgi:hypothetical protein
VAINYWIAHGLKSEQISEAESNFVQQRDAGIFMGWEREEHLYDQHTDVLNDDQISQIYGNHLINDPSSRLVSRRKLDIMQNIPEKGFIYNVQLDNDFTFNDNRNN